MPSLIGQSLGRYHILEQLGEGGMATVYKAYDTRLERDVAVKVIRKSAFSQEVVERMLKRFEREAKALARLTHPNIVGVIDYGEYEGSPYLVMPYLPGGTLKQRLGKPIPWQDAARTLLPISRALQFAHEQSIVHRDVKPANILITLSGEPMLTDFGIAKILETDEVTALTSTGMGVGTPEYMAPEQWAGNAGPQTDIYALGVVLYEMITGRKPYIADTPPAIMLKQATEPLPPPEKYVPGLPEAVEKVLLKALAKPENRYTDMAALAGAMEFLLSSQLVGRERTIEQSTGEITQDAQESSTGRVESSRVPTPEKNSSWLWVAGAGILLVLVCIFAAVSILLGLMTKPTPTSPATPAEAQGSMPTAASVPNDAITPFFTIVFSDTPFVPTPTQALGIGSTQARLLDGMAMAYVPAGDFTMGDLVDQAMSICQVYFTNCTSSWFTDEQPPHSVSLDSYWIDVTEVSNGMFALCVQAGLCQPPSNSSSSTRSNYYGNPQYADYPVINVDWNQATRYCTWAGARLPTEAEWEKAARGSDGRIFPWGNSLPDCSLSNFGGCNGDTSPVGGYSYGASPYTTLNMGGNVSEWVNDWYSGSTYSSAAQSDPAGPSGGQDRLARGGSWNLNPNFIRSVNRDHLPPYTVRNDIGFRCATSAIP
jgi:serine/threonine protein kinase